MTSPVLLPLRSDEFVAEYGYIATPTALARALQKAPAVQAIGKALDAREVPEEAVRTFANELMKELKPGEPFRFDLAIAALAVVLQGQQTPFAQEYLRDLAHLDLAEMSMSIRVARECLRAQEPVSSPQPAATADLLNNLSSSVPK